MLIQCLIWMVIIFVVAVLIVTIINYIFNNMRLNKALFITLLLFVFTLPIIASIELFIYRKITLSITSNINLNIKKEPTAARTSGFDSSADE